MRTAFRRHSFGQVTSSRRAVLWRVRTCPWYWNASPTTPARCCRLAKNHYFCVLPSSLEEIVPANIWVVVPNQPRRSRYNRKPEDSIVTLQKGTSVFHSGGFQGKTRKQIGFIDRCSAAQLGDILSLNSFGSGMSSWRFICRVCLFLTGSAETFAPVFKNPK